MANPVTEADRIQTLDILRGFALLGILIMNIIGFGMVSAAYTAPGLINETSLDNLLWFISEFFAEGSMRGLFSILFGAGVILFLGRSTEGRGWLHYKRTFWLLMFGLFNGYILMWSGDILVTYALCGFVLYFFRNVSANKLLITSIVLTTLLTGFVSMMHFGLRYLQTVDAEVGQLIAAGEEPSAEQWEMAAGWQEFSTEITPDKDTIAEELSARGDSLASVFEWNLERNTQILTDVMPMFFLPDAFVVMLLGMALFKLGVLQGDRSQQFYVRLMVIGFVIGVSTNVYEAWRAYSSNFETLTAMTYLYPTYHIGRIGVALGWMSLLILIYKNFNWGSRLAAVGRMALTNYLTQSLICLFIFTGAGLGLVGEMNRAELYLTVVAIWILQLLYSPWWLARYHYGPVEWLWRMLTYGQVPRLARDSD